MKLARSAQRIRSVSSSVRRVSVRPPTCHNARWCSAKPVEKDDDDMVAEEPVTIEVDPAAGAAEAKPEEAAQPAATPTGDAETHGFKAATKQLLDIVARSLYTEKEVFIRELISNASDAMEKRKHLQVTEPETVDDDSANFEINLRVNPDKKTFSIADVGIGMNKEELQANLGTIAQSGSKSFVTQLQKTDVTTEQASQIIGQFGVGFYSIFMVSESVTVTTRSCRKGEPGYIWQSDGVGEYTIQEADNVPIGTEITLQLKDIEGNFAVERLVENIIKKYSNFINFPIRLNNSRVNTVSALWKASPKDVTEEEHAEFYKFISKSSSQSALFRLHYTTDHPMAVRALFYIPENHTESMGLGKMEMNVHLYSRGVMIQQKSKALLPEWLRFLHGVVDSEEIPLNISRETAQDGMIMRNLKSILTRKVLRWMADESRRDAEKFQQFHSNFYNFLREGICTDVINKDQIAKLLRFESSKSSECVVSLDNYIENMVEGQDNIFYIVGPNRAACEQSPYMEEFSKKGVEVLFSYSGLDQFAFDHLQSYGKKSLKSVDAKDINLDKIAAGADDPADAAERELTEAECKDFSDWLQNTCLKDKLSNAAASTRLSSSPAIVVGHEQINSIRMQRMMSMMQGKKNDMLTEAMAMQKYSLEFNPRHEIVKRLYFLSKSSDSAQVSQAHMLGEQLYDNALIAAGLLEDPRSMLNRLNKLMESSLSHVEVPDAATQQAAEEVLSEEPAQESKA